MDLLNDAWDMAPDKATKIIDLPTNNRHRKMKAIIKKAGVEPWPDLFQHLRRCCRTQWLNEGLPPHAVSRWMGHGHKVGDEHYTMLTDDIVERVTQRAAESAALGSDIEPNQAQATKRPVDQAQKKTSANTGFTEVSEVVRGGFEPPTHGFSVHCSTN